LKSPLSWSSSDSGILTSLTFFKSYFFFKLLKLFKILNAFYAFKIDINFFQNKEEKIYVPFVKVNLKKSEISLSIVVNK